jgi:hypothetical protein
MLKAQGCTLRACGWAALVLRGSGRLGCMRQGVFREAFSDEVVQAPEGRSMKADAWWSLGMR